MELIDFGHIKHIKHLYQLGYTWCLWTQIVFKEAYGIGQETIDYIINLVYFFKLNIIGYTFRSSWFKEGFLVLSCRLVTQGEELRVNWGRKKDWFIWSKGGSSSNVLEKTLL